MAFKVGDIIRNQNDGMYNVTSKHALCKIVTVRASGDIEVRVVARTDGKAIGNAVYVVHPGTFAVATNEEIRDFGLSNASSPRGEIKMKFFNQVSDYVEKHKDILFTIALVLVLDHYVFDGKFKQKVEDLVSGFLSKHAPTLPGTPAA